MAKLTTVVIFFLGFLGIALGQIPIHESGMCAGVFDGISRVKVSDGLFPQPRAATLRGSGVCQEYSFAGWDDPVRLYLGEGSEDYIELIESAAEMWNAAVRGWKLTNMIQIVKNSSPSNESVDDRFWSDPERYGRRNIGDGQSVIYFVSGESASSGTTWFERKSTYRMGEADVYINPFNEEAHTPYPLANTVHVVGLTETTSIYAFVSSTFVTIVHELGHLLGLNHINVSGNIMGYNYMPRLIDQWRAPMMMYLFSQQDPTESNVLSFSDDSVLPYMAVTDERMISLMDIFTSSMTLGEQDKTALMCSYGSD